MMIMLFVCGLPCHKQYAYWLGFWALEQIGALATALDPSSVNLGKLLNL